MNGEATACRTRLYPAIAIAWFAGSLAQSGRSFGNVLASGDAMVMLPCDKKELTWRGRWHTDSHLVDQCWKPSRVMDLSTCPGAEVNRPVSRNLLQRGLPLADDDDRM